MRLLLSVEANNFVIIHTVFFLVHYRDGLNKTNHCFVALGIEFAIITGLNRLKFAVSLCLWQRRKLWLDGVFEVGKETDAILKFDLERLVVYGGPGSGHVLLSASYSILAKNGLNLELIH